MGRSSSARLAASTMGSGVRKSGSPITSEITSRPSRSSSRARVWISITSNGSMAAMRAASWKRVGSFIAGIVSLHRLAQVVVPELGQALGRDGERRAQLLREERDAQLLDQPAELLE